MYNKTKSLYCPMYCPKSNVTPMAMPRPRALYGLALDENLWLFGILVFANCAHRAGFITSTSPGVRHSRHTGARRPLLSDVRIQYQ